MSARLGYRPALDGLRGVAIALVLLSHVNREWVGLGIVGVVLFFVLSGFLITTLLLEEHAATGSISLRRFYLRRVLRLAPALVVVVTAATILAAAWWGPRYALGMAGASVLYVGNWARVIRFDLGPMGHAWTLAVEEQFYLLWPLGLIALLATRRVIAVVAVLVAASIVERFVLTGIGASGNYLSFASELYVAPLLGGALLALWRFRHGLPRIPASMTWAAVVGLLALSALPLSALAISSVLTTALTALIIAGVLSRPVLTWTPLVTTGRISYGMYLWHGPLLWTVLPFLPAPFGALGVIVLTYALAGLSWRYVEQPFLRLRRLLRESDPIKVGARVPTRVVRGDGEAY